MRIRNSIRWFAEAARTHPFNFFTLIIAFSALGLTAWGALEAHWQTADSKRASDEQKKDVERSRKAAEGSQIAAEELARVTERISASEVRTAKAAEISTKLSAKQLRAALSSLIAQQRPALEVVHFELANNRDEISVTLKNSGHSTAQEVRTEGRVEIGRSWSFTFTKKSDGIPTHLVQNSDIPSGSEAKTAVDIPSDERMIKCCGYELSKDTIRIYVTVHYSDSDKRHYRLATCYDAHRFFMQGEIDETVVSQCYATWKPLGR